MKLKHYLSLLAMAAVSLPVASIAADNSTFQLKNRLRVEYDDNVYETDNDTVDSFKIIEEVEFLVNLNYELTYIGLRYRPTFVWWENRDPDSEDFHNDFDLVFAHKFTQRLTLNLKDTFRAGEEPKEIDRGSTVRENDDYVYNVADGSLNYLLRPETRVDLGGRYTLLRYDRDAVSKTDDYDIYAGGLTLRQEFGKDSTVLGEYRYESTEYTDVDDRGSDSQYVGAGLEQVFSPNLLGNIRAGAQFKTFNDDNIDDETSPYVDSSLTFLPSPRTRLTAGVGYSLYEADVTSYANQERLIGYLSMAYDLTARVSLYGAASYQEGQYNADQSILPAGTVLQEGTASQDEIAVTDGSEETTQFSARAAYKINKSNWLEAGWEYLTLNSDLRQNFDRNRISLGWRTEL